MGGMTNTKMDALACEIWDFAIEKGLWIQASFLKGSLNTAADLGSRILSERTEWSLPTVVFQQIVHALFLPTIDLFASRLNAKLPRYVSWIPDPYCEDVDCFLLNWSQESPFLFPPFSLLYRTLQKILHDTVDSAILVFLIWTTQHWFPQLLSLLVLLIYYALRSFYPFFKGNNKGSLRIHLSTFPGRPQLCYTHFTLASY